MQGMKRRGIRAAWWRWIPAAAIVTALSVVAGAQTQAPPAQQPPAGQTETDDPSAVFRTGVTLVTTDVIVRDDSGVFLADLTKGDFVVYEDDRPQEIASLVLVHGGRVYNQLLIPPPAREGIILPPTRPVNDTAGRIFVIFVDDLHLETSKTPRIRQVFETLADTLIHEGDLFGIVSTGPSSISIDMTYDRSLLSLAADRITGDGFNPTEMIQYLAEGASGPSELQWRAHVAFKTAREIVQNLEQVQNRRKAFIYFSSGYDFNPFAHERIFARSPMAQAMRQDIEQGFDRDELEDLYDGVADPLTDPFEQITRRGQVFSDAELAMEISELTKAANRANASFYTVDPRGLVAGPDIDYQGPTQAFNNFLSTTQNSLRALAELTGGMAVVNRNDFDDAFKEIDADTSDYYILGFYSSNADPTYRTRRLRVEINREGVDVRSRTHYTFARPDEGRPPAP